MRGNALGLAVLLLAGAALGTVAVRARERTYVVPARGVPQPVPSVLSGEQPPGFEVRTLEVEGICCPGCAPKLRGRLAEVEGVREVAVDASRKVVLALVRSDVPVAALEAALTFDEYSARAR